MDRISEEIIKHNKYYNAGCNNATKGNYYCYKIAIRTILLQHCKFTRRGNFQFRKQTENTTFKIDYKIEGYLNIRLPHHITSAIAKWFTGTHKLGIETNRYTRPRISQNYMQLLLIIYNRRRHSPSFQMPTIRRTQKLLYKQNRKYQRIQHWPICKANYKAKL